MLVDFHVHSTASDGSCSPSQLAEKASDFAAIAITDHDNTDGVAEFFAADAAPGLRRVAGVELSIEAGRSFDKFHLLALGVDMTNERLRGFLDGILVGRRERNERIIANFRALGIEMVEGLEFSRTIYAYAHGEVLARPHFARWLADNGKASSYQEAFDRYLLPDSPRESRCYEERYHPSQEEAFDVVHGAGALAVMAHPKYWRREWKTGAIDYDAAARELARLKEAGLDGLECLYQANSTEENICFTRIAETAGLVKTAGSDFHGSPKPAISLGMEVPESFIGPLLERLP